MRKTAQRQNHFFRKLWRELEETSSAVRGWSFPDGRRLCLTLKVTGAGVQLRFWKTYFKAVAEGDSSCCDECRAHISRLKYPTTEEHLESLIYEAQDIVATCPTRCRPPAPVQVIPVPVEVNQPRVRVSPDSEENRIKFLSEGQSTNTPEQTSQSSDTIIVKKPTNNVKILKPGQTEQNLSSRQFETESVARHVYGAPSIRYSTSSRSEVEVTIPRYLCEQVIHHCAESNRTQREVGGILIGYTSETDQAQRGGTFIQNNVTNLLPVKPANSSVSHLTIDHETWLKVGETIDTQYTPQGKVRLGWYHTHPNQGIFFSGQDKDTHTNFTLPFQFALVIDPRTMLAGLFAWDHYETRSLVESHHFPLKLRSATSQQYSEQSNPQDFGGPDDSNLSFSVWRIFFFGVALITLVFYLVVIVDPPGIGPNQAILIAFAVFLGLRLWNAHFFNPRTVIEIETCRRIGRSIGDGAGRLATDLSHHPSVAHALFLVALLLAVGVGASFGYLYLTSQTPQVAQTIVPGQTANKIVVAPSDAPPIVLTVKEKVDTQKTTLVVAVNSVNATVEYTKVSRGTVWQPRGSEESEFFQKAFSLNLSQSSPEVKDLQKNLTVATGGLGSSTQDGQWGKGTRELFIQWLNLHRNGRSGSIKNPADGRVVIVQWASE